jgi:hypothetical protein
MAEMNETNRMHIAKVDFDEAQQLADYAGISQDLTFVLEVLSRLHDLLERDGDEADAVMVRAYWTAALIAYSSCFGSGKRLGLSESIYEDTDGGVEVHRHYRALRDKHVAHSVNPFEQVEVGVVLSAPGAEERKIEGVAAIGLNLLSHGIEGVEQFHELATLARAKAGAECDRHQEATRVEAEKMGLDGLYATATMRSIAPGPDDAARPRS